jgi:hypothetical protein
MKKLIGLFIICCLFYGFEGKQNREDIELVICMDLSASTNGLLQSLEKSIWEIAYDFNRYYPEPKVKIGLVLYGRNSFKKKFDYAQLQHNLTSKYDLFITELHELPPTVSNGEVYVGSALNIAVNRINWSEGSGTIKMISLIGNGDLTNGNISTDKIVEIATKKNIIVNTLYFKRYDNFKERKRWEKLAKKGNGVYSEFGLNEPAIVFHKKYDSEWIQEIGLMLNDTYIPYGKTGLEQLNEMKYLDSLAHTIGIETEESRVMFKASRLYQRSNSSWDLIDKVSISEVDWGKVKREFLPVYLQKMNNVKLKEYIHIKKVERKELIAELAVQAVKRDLHLYRKRAKLSVFRFEKEFSVAFILNLNKSLAPYFRASY